MSLSKKLKSIIKGNPEPSKFGSDASDAWSAKYNVNESGSLNTYLSARGINPKFLSRDAKISHAKSTQFAKWKRDHQFEEVETISEDAMLDTYLKSRGMNPQFITKDKKISIAKSSAFLTWKMHHMQTEGMSLQHTPTELRKHALNKAKHMNKIVTTDGLHKEEVDKLDTITFDIPLLIRVLEYAREDAKTDMDLHKVTEKLISIRDKGTLTMADYDFIVKLKEEYELSEGAFKRIATDREEDARLKKMSALDKFRADASAREKKHNEIEKKQSKDGSGMSAAIDRLEKHLNKEETEQIDELKKSTVKSWLGKQQVVPPKKPGMDKKAHNQRIKTRSKSWDSALDRLTGRKPTSEDIYQDSQAATQTNFDGANSPDDCTCDKKKEMSKSARIIKSLYKKFNVKEELYDHEKEDKSVATYGKKPKTVKADVTNNGDTAPQAAAVLKGGKTLTGQTRDTLEIDPLMRKPLRPDQKQADTKEINKKNKAI
jgi:hypothetical protein